MLLQDNLIIVSAHYSEDLKWLRSSRYPVLVVSKLGSKQAAIPIWKYIPNRGAEASAYLTFIVNCYNQLPEWTAFIHGHKHAWHHKQGDNLKQLQMGDWKRSTGFHTLNGIEYEWKQGEPKFDLLLALWPQYFQC
jgi:hypothetical protein